MRLTRQHIVQAVMVFLALGLGLWIYWLHGRPKREVERYKNELRAKGERLTIAELLPASLLPERNGTRFFQQATAYLSFGATLLDTNPPLPMHMIAPGRAIIGWHQPDIRDRSTNTWEEAEQALHKDEAALDLLEQLTDRPGLDFQLDYTQGALLMLPHLSRLKQGARTLSIAAMCALRRGDANLAVKQTRSMLAIAQGMDREPLVISQLVRMAIVHMALATQWELLQSTNLSDGDLADLQKSWLDQDFLQPAEQSLAMERAMAEHMLAQMRESSAQFRRYAAGWANGPSWGNASGNGFEKIAGVTAMKAQEIQWRSAWSSPDELKKLRGDQIFLEALRLARTQGFFTNSFQQQQIRLAELGIAALKDKPDDGFSYHQPELKNLFSSSLHELQGLIHRVFMAEVARSLAVTGLALKRYQLQNGRYPSALTQLVPGFLPAVPRDPFDGQALRYRVNPDGTFVLYSIGEDGQDNGGDPTPISDAKPKSFSWQKGRDLVWPQPQRMEIQNSKSETRNKPE